MAAPSVSLITADGITLSTQNPVVHFSGADTDGDRIRYEVELISQLPRTGSRSLRGAAFAQGGGLIAGARSNVGEAIFTSTDGVAYERTDGLGGTTTVQMMEYLNGIFILSRNSLMGIYTSTNGISWSGVRANTAGLSYKGAAYGAGLYLAYSTQAAYKTSPDGISWTSRTFPVSAINSVAYTGDRFLASHNTHGLYESTDGITWTQITGVPPGALVHASNGSMAAGSGSAVSHFGASSNQVYYSNDNGATWATTGLTDVQSTAYYNGYFYMLAKSTYPVQFTRLYRRRAGKEGTGYDDMIELPYSNAASRISVGPDFIVWNTSASEGPLMAMPHSHFASSDTGFTNVSDPSDLDPFLSGSEISYQFQTSIKSGDYWWTARGLDVQGSNEWGARAPLRSMSVTRPQNNSIFMQFLM